MPLSIAQFIWNSLSASGLKSRFDDYNMFHTL